MRFYLGAPEPAWLSRSGKHPLFVSHRRMVRQASWKPAVVPWALDSGGFTELSMFGGWRTSASDYVLAVRRYQDEIGSLEWVAPQDWMCEPFMLAKTGLSVRQHQELTIRSVIELREALGEIVVPVLQGWTIGDYLYHVEMYEAAGIRLRDEPTVGVGSVCRRQAASEVAELVERLSGIALHGFGVKVSGLRAYGSKLKSSDSLAWSYTARVEGIRLPGHTHKVCSSCREWAEQWADRIVANYCGSG